MLNKLKAIFRKKSEPEIIEIFRAGGHTFKVLSPAKMSKVRQTRFFFEEYSREWGMTKEDILDFDGVILAETEAPVSRSLHDLNADLLNKLARIKTMVSLRSAMIKEDHQYKPFLKSAAVIILMDDEDEFVLSPEIEIQKMKLCRDYPEIEAFFLRVIRIFQLGTKDSQDILKIWEWLPSTEIKVMENIVLKEINSTIYGNGIT
jgi:hypothetical protein